MRKRTRILTDEPQASLEIDVPAISLRQRLERESESLMLATSGEIREAPSNPLASENGSPAVVNAETLETLSRLHTSLSETAEEIARELERTAGRTATQLREAAAEIARRSDAQTSDTTQRLSELQRMLSETERNLAYTVERLRRENARARWMQTAVIGLALLAGTLGGTAAALLILTSMR
jgi:DNA anti-recombination protein RmuC